MPTVCALGQKQIDLKFIMVNPSFKKSGFEGTKFHRCMNMILKTLF